MINARSETASSKPSFRAAFKRRRCLVVADGFYEWSKQDGQKIPMYVHLQAHQLFAMAGLWEIWQSADGDEVRTCTILTTTPNELVKPYHHRMAVILHPDDYETWLDDEAPTEVLESLLIAYPSEEMAVYPVSKIVNSPANDVPECIEPNYPPEQQSLL
jgi:putative SOS response-associated peptidase YedK